MSTAPGGGTRVTAVMAACNRWNLTLACLRSLRAQQIPDVALDVFVLDDASSDGISVAIAERFPEVTVLYGDGQLDWNGGYGARSPPQSPATMTLCTDTCKNPTKETVPIPSSHPVARR